MTNGYSSPFCCLCASTTSLLLLQPGVCKAHRPAERKISVCGHVLLALSTGMGLPGDGDPQCLVLHSQSKDILLA